MHAHMIGRITVPLALLATLTVGCSIASTDDATSSSSADSTSKTAIKHVVVIVQENHTFDAYFGQYCQAPTGSNPTCTDGPGCCEAAPDKITSVHGDTMGPEELTDSS